MKSKLFIFFSMLIIFSSFISASELNSEKLDSRIIKELTKEETANVIITLKTPDETFPLAENLEEIQENKVFSAELTESELNFLVRDQNVERIEYNYPIQVFLQDTVNILEAPKLWNSGFSGISFTGKNLSVCVIDTGVDYTHPDLGGCFGPNCKVVGGYDFVNNDDDPIDDSGHGTHVAGIIAANGGIKGIAPDAQIVAIKAMDSKGYGYVYDVQKGVKWCREHSEEFNIVTITMSLGTLENFSTYCDNTQGFIGLTEEINEALAKNIKVIAAAGNSANHTGIAAPACIQNVTAVSATTKTDAIATYSNYNSLVDFFAPGGDNFNQIISTKKGAGYEGMHGTSMAAPHVAAAIAVLRDFIDFNNLQLNSQELESQFKANGIPISAGNLTIPRIDLYKTALSLDSIPPNVTLQSTITNKNASLSCNAEDFTIRNGTLLVWKNNNLVYNFSSTEKQINLTLEINFSQNSKYEFNCLFNDENNNFASAENNLTIYFNGTFVSLIYPKNPTYTNNSLSDFRCSFETDTNSELANSILFIWNSTNQLFNETKLISGIINQTNFFFNLTNEGNYEWNCLVENNNSESVFSERNFSITIDTQHPNISLISPNNSQSLNAGNINFNFVINNPEVLDVCTFILNNQSVSNTTSNSFTTNLPQGFYIWQVQCLDKAGNLGISEERNLTIIQPPQQSSSGGGSSSGSSGGGSPAVNTLSSQNQTLNNSVQLLNSQTKDSITSSIKNNTLPQNSSQDKKINQISGFAAFSFGNIREKLSAYKLIISYIILGLIFIGAFVIFKKKRRVKIMNNFFYNPTDFS